MRSRKINRLKQRNPFSDRKIAANYEGWYQTGGREADQKEKSLISWLLNNFEHSGSMLEIGCGTGHFTRWLEDKNKSVIGLDLSFPMLEVAKELGSTQLCLGQADVLPFSQKSFDLVLMITTLEFLRNPEQVLKEVQRVSRKGLVLGVINQNSLLGLRYQRKGGQIWDQARFFSVSGLKKIMREVFGNQVMMIWKTTLWPGIPCSLPLPWGGFIGMAVKW